MVFHEAFEEEQAGGLSRRVDDQRLQGRMDSDVESGS